MTANTQRDTAVRDHERPHVTVFFAGQSEAWARWIDHQLRSAGRASTAVRWNPLRRPQEGGGIGLLQGAPGQVLVVVDDWYEHLGTSGLDAWLDVLRSLDPALRARVGAVSVTTRDLSDEIVPLAPVGLRGLGPAAARALVLQTVGLDGAPAAVSLDRGPRFPDDPPEIFGVPRRNRRFVGRADLLDTVRGRLSVPGERAVLHGPGGVGKSQLALEYVHRFRGEYDIVWWVGAAGRVAAREQYARLGAELGLPGHNELQHTIEAVHRELVRTRRPWLLVFDGAGAPERLSGLLPEGGRGHILVTTQDLDWAAQAESVAVDAFERQESVAFAALRSHRLTEEQADQLAEAVEDLPLLLDQMAAWLDVNPMASVTEYIDDIREGRPGQFQVVPSPSYPQSFQVAWAKLLNTLRDTSPPAWHLLHLLAHFSPDLGPVRLLRAALGGPGLPEGLRELSAEPSSWNAALRKLSEITSMRVEYEQGPHLDIQTIGTLRMHRLFHGYVRSVQSHAEARKYSAIARRVLVLADPRDPAPAANWPRYAELIPHLEPSGALDSTDTDVRALVLNCIEYQRVRGEYEDGLWLSDEAATRWRGTLGDTHRSVLVARHQHANMLRRLGRYGEAEHVGRDTLALLRENPATRPIELIRAEDGLAGTLMARGRFDEARALVESAVARAAQELGEDDVPRTLALRNNLAVAVGLQGRYEDSLAQHRRVLGARVELLGGKNALTLGSALRTARMLRLLGRYREALSEQERNARLHAQVLGKRHAETLAAEHHHALCARRVGDLQLAHALLRSVHERQLDRRGARHPGTLMAACDYAMLLRELGRGGEARELLTGVVDDYQALLGPEHPYAIGARDNLGVLMLDDGQAAAAAELSRITAAEMEEAVGDDHPWTVGSLLNRAAAVAALGGTEDAAALGADALERATRTLGASHVLTATVRTGLALDLAALGDPAAEGHRARALADLTALLGEDNPHARSAAAGTRPHWDFEPQPV
ncbi:FxSxx-COOH system tetratricopeptide repeat protein [Streptomyces sp. NPDC050560]|uniref:FxSxx-COOH system tetratricopeptide repeat protein n=1 Tax=Streptomyces sp. NPDC050560 TaxID=3365630 RepID=UPI0037877665